MTKLLFRKKLLFSAILFLAALALAETASRLLYPLLFIRNNCRSNFDLLISGRLSGGYFPTYKPHVYSIYTLRDGHALNTGEIVHTADGFRAPAIAKSKPADTFRIALLGGSTTYDNGKPFLRTYAAYLEEFIQKSFPGRKIEALNAGVGGYTSAETFQRFHFNVLDYSPDMVVIYDGINDVWPRIFSTDFHYDYRDTRKVMTDAPPPSPGKCRLMKISFIYRIYYWTFVLKGGIPDIKSMTYKSLKTVDFEKSFNRTDAGAFRRNIEDIIYICQGRKIIPFLVTMAVDEKALEPASEYKILVRGTREHNEAIRKISASLNVPLYDLEKIMPLDKGYFGDICHTTSAGNRIKAMLISEGIIPLLEKKFNTAAVPLENVQGSGEADAEVYRQINGMRTRITRENSGCPLPSR